MIRNATLKDAREIAEIYNYYILNTLVTFEETPVEVSEMRKRMKEIILKLPWIVYEEEGIIVGYAYASDWKKRSGYKHTVETTVYLKNGESGNGIGSILYTELINRLTKMNFHSLIGGIALPNNASKALHEKFNYKKVAHFKEVGYKFNTWIDVGYWELMIYI